MKLPIRKITYTDEELPDDLTPLLATPRQASPETIDLFRHCIDELGNISFQHICWTDGNLDLSFRYRGCDMRYLIAMDAPGSYELTYGYRADMPEAIRPPPEAQSVLYPLLFALAAKAHNFPMQEETDGN